ncbi:MAG: helix-turn-helix transcriptional regulator [Proteobacteria bacterium]|nr:helix-turn-helix transcriptional regulator [Pseudomonadota bacterium]
MCPQLFIIGPKVRQIRESQGLTQEEFTARCNLLEWDISRSTLAKIESQVRRITDEEAALLAASIKGKINELYK